MEFDTKKISLLFQIMDKNDNPPLFEAYPYRVHLAENSLAGTLVTRVHAHDPDLGSNGEVR